MVRFLLLLLGATLGLALGALHAWLIYHFKGPFVRDSLGEHLLILAPTATFISTIYNTGKVGYWLLGREDKIEEIRSGGLRGRILLLNAFTIVLIIASFFIK